VVRERGEAPAAGRGVRNPARGDFILCFQYREDAEKVLAVLGKRLAKYGLTLHPDKTRLIEVGREVLGKWEVVGGAEAQDL
jgi:hypothetical protein